MKTCLVSMISDQTIPNILVAAELMPDFLLFLSTDSMERKKKALAVLKSLAILGLDYSTRYKTVLVPEDSIPDFIEKVTDWVKQNRSEYRFIVNLTGGTKLMSLAAYEAFNTYGAEMIYTPVSKNHYFPVHRPSDIASVKTRLSVEAYLAGYGVEIRNIKAVKRLVASARARERTSFFIFEHYNKLEPLLLKLGGELRRLKKDDLKKGVDLTIDWDVKSSVEKELLGMTGFSCRGSLISKKIALSDRDYLRGGWLEERFFFAMEAILHDSSDILLGPQCELNGARNEYDVLASCDNTLYVVECKTLQQHEGAENDPGATISNFLYKLGATRQNFGLTPKGFLATTSRDILDLDGNIKPHLVDRSRLFNIQLIPLWQIDNLEKWLKENVFSR